VVRRPSGRCAASGGVDKVGRKVGRVARAQRCDQDDLLRDRAGAEPLHLGGAEGAGRADGGGPPLPGVALVAAGEVAREQSDADRDLVGVGARADQVVGVVAIVPLLDRLLGAPATARRPAAAGAGRGSSAAGRVARRVQ